MSESKSSISVWKKAGFIVLMTTLFFPFQGKGQDYKLNLTQAVDSALNNNQQIQQYLQQVQQKKYLVKAAKGNRLLSINASGGYTYLSQNPEINMSKVEGSVRENIKLYAGTIAQSGLIPVPDLPLFSNVMQTISQLPLYNITVDQDKYANLSVTALQPLYTGGKINAGIRYAKADLGQSKQELQLIKNQIISETIKNYYSVVLMKEVVKTREQVVSGMKKHLSQAEKAFKVGFIPSQDVLRARVAFANAEQALEDDQNKLKLAQLALKTSMGNNDPGKIETTERLTYFPIPVNLENLLKQALEQQPMLNIIDQQEIMVNQKMAKERSEFLPQIAAYGTYSAFNKEQPVIMPPFMIGVQAKINLFDGFKKFHRIKATQHLEKRVAAARNYTSGQIKLWVNKSYLNALDNQNKYLHMKATLELSDRSLQITKKRFQEGLSKSIDVIDAYLLNEKIRTEQLHALYGYYISLTDMYMASGHTEKAVEMLQASNHQ